MEDMLTASDRSLPRGPSPTKQFAALQISPKPSKRATSLKKPRKKLLENVELSEIRPRTSSLPSRNCFQKSRPQYLSPFIDNISESECYTMRTFVTTRKGLVNRGDSVRSRSTNSIASSGSGSMTELTPLSGTSSSLSASANSLVPAYVLRVLVIGAPGVGKTSLKRQFMTSEYIGVSDSIGEYLFASLKAF
ncbi:hypothetical protein LOTGIDRAFT_159634 [Lottia gigantea]|uniref:Uncharacterized protein n=1 Tax=Lottia gigantea TaxID=225164 RepID=V4AQ30_LOTGI|nr:hypothetical protein LOTGIDRAFT_159634 [Lottia gigantea]ESO96885.1 hypothetical protein LOTGIDRAFT_159634 [Lottia gigantea]